MTKISIHSQYIKDSSFENPNSPQSITKITQKPDIGFNIDIAAANIKENFYEVILTLSVNAKSPDDKNYNIFLVELKYGGVFEIEDAQKDELKEILLINCPTILFPFARRIIADMTRDGGFPPMMMEPIDFKKIYDNNKNKEQQEKTDSTIQ